MEQSSDSIINLASGISDIKEIYNYRCNYQTNQKDDYSVLLGMRLEQNESALIYLIKSKGSSVKSISEMVKKSSFVLFLNQTIVDLNRFSTMNTPSNYFSLLSIDTTYQIAEHYLRQTAYENLSILQRDTLKSPFVCYIERKLLKNLLIFGK